METAITVEAEAFEAVVRAYRQRIFRFALCSLRDRDAAESVTQDCLFKAYKAWPKFRRDASVLTWLMRIAVNLIRDASNSRRFRFWKMRAVNVDSVSDWISDPGRSPEERVRAKQQVEAIYRICNHLSERQRTVFLLHFMEDMDAGQIEAVTGITKAAIKVHLFRAVRLVRSELKEWR
jgi:RNA polymerase sigma-70 factor, ECF subfamily